MSHAKSYYSFPGLNCIYAGEVSIVSYGVNTCIPNNISITSMCYPE